MTDEEFKELQEFDEFKNCPCSYGGFGDPSFRLCHLSSPFIDSRHASV
jgi:hypothetical protein